MLGINRLGRERADAAEVLRLTPAHRGIENRPHGVRDGTSGEDASRILEGGSARVMAIRRDAIIPCPGRAGHRNAADASRHDAWHPGKAIDLLSTPT